MTRCAHIGLFALVCCLPARSLHAHHSVASEYDVDKRVTVTGTVVKLEWTNPHGRVFIDAKDEAGNVSHWEFELGSVNAYVRRGWTRNSLKIGDLITASGALARKTPNLATGENFVLPDGRKVLIGTSPDGQPTR